MVPRSTPLPCSTRATLVSRVRPTMFRHPDGDDGGDGGDGDSPPEGDDKLGEAGQRALAAERAAKREAEKKAREAEKRAAEAEKRAEEALKRSQTDEEKAIAEKVAAQVAEAQKDAETKIADAERRVKVSALKAAAAGRLADPGDAAAFIDVDELDADDDASISAAIDDLLARKPHLAAQQQKQAGGGSADQGHRGNAAPNFRDREQLAAATRALGVRLRS